MEKISLYSLLSVLLPGAILTLLIDLFLKNVGIDLSNYEFNNYLILTVFLSTSIFIGSLIDVLTRNMLGKYRRIGLNTPIYTYYKEDKFLAQIKPFINADMQKRYKATDEGAIEQYWSLIYYDLEAKGNITVPKSFQSFYFFFRNFFTLGWLMAIMIIVLLLIKYDNMLLLILSATIIMMIISVFVGRWYRKKMIERTFWTYYSLYKNL